MHLLPEVGLNMLPPDEATGIGPQAAFSYAVLDIGMSSSIAQNIT